MMPTRRFLHSRVTIPSINLPRGTVRLCGTPEATTPAQCCLAAAPSHVDGRGPPTDLHQSPHLAAPVVGSDNVDVTGAWLL
jgi:hypothetical protein